MVVRKRKKHRRFRGRRTYHGSHKKWRGAGRRGGRGRAGLHKHKWTWVVKYVPDWFGKRGFKRPPAVVRPVRTINLRELDQLAARLVREGLAKRVRGKVKIDLAELGYDKLLGTGRVTQPLDVKVPTFTQRAVQKVEQVGGQVKRP